MRNILISLLVALFLAQPALAAPEVTPSERVRRNVVVRAEPDGDAAPLGALLPGQEVELLGEVPGWYHVRLSDGRVGYVSKSWTVVTADSEPLAAVPSGPLKVHVIDIGTGLATFIEGPGFTMLYDAGSQDDLATGQDNRVVAYIKAVRPDVTKIPKWLDQIWFAGCHSDVGGSYLEDESRLSDIALDWMAGELKACIPSIIITSELLVTNPDSLGLQHDEIWMTKRWYFKRKWKRDPRHVEAQFRLHQSVVDRLAASAVPELECSRPYRPTQLAAHPQAAWFFA